IRDLIVTGVQTCALPISSEQHKVIAKLDLAEFADGKAVPVDYKHGRPIAAEDGYQPWPSERVQLAIQAIVLRANGYRCDEGIIRSEERRVGKGWSVGWRG